MQIILNTSGERAGVAVSVYVLANSARDPQEKKRNRSSARTSDVQEILQFS